MYDFDLFGEASGLCKPQLSPVGRQRRSDLWRGLLPPPSNQLDIVITKHKHMPQDKHKEEDRDEQKETQPPS